MAGKGYTLKRHPVWSTLAKHKHKILPHAYCDYIAAICKIQLHFVKWHLSPHILEGLYPFRTVVLNSFIIDFQEAASIYCSPHFSYLITPNPLSIHLCTTLALPQSQIRFGGRSPRRLCRRHNVPPAGGPASRGQRQCRRVHPPDRTASPLAAPRPIQCPRSWRAAP